MGAIRIGEIIVDISRRNGKRIINDIIKGISNKAGGVMKLMNRKGRGIIKMGGGIRRSSRGIGRGEIRQRRK